MARGRKMRMNREDFEEEKPKMAHACHAMPLLSVRPHQRLYKSNSRPLPAQARGGRILFE